MARILIVGKGGYGDMFPMFAIAQKLKANGHEVSIAGEGHHEDSINLLDIPLIKIDHESAFDAPTSGNSALKSFRLIAEVMHTLSPAHLDQEYEILLAIAKDYDLIVGNQLAYSGSIVCKKLGKPWVFCAPSPLAFPSYYDPPLFPYLHRLQNLSMAYPATQYPYIKLARWASKLMMTSIARQRRRLGISNSDHPRFEGMYSEHLNLLMTSPLLVTPQPDWPQNTVLTGFSWFEPDFMRGQEKLNHLAEFIQSGPSPIIFAPGGNKRTEPGAFYSESIKACQLLGKRAILLAAHRFHDALPQSPNVLITGYLPFSTLLNNASAIVHSGGIGAIGWSLRFGIPSLLVPSSWDQFDNAHRACQQNFASVLAQQEYKAAAIAANLDKLLHDPTRRQLLQNITDRVAGEDGARIACDRIESVLASFFSTR